VVSAVTVPAIYDVQVSHARTTPLRNVFSYASYLWLVDIDRLPRLRRPWRALARIEARDHLGEPSATIRANLENYLAGHGIDLAGGRVLLLTNARSLGHVFNPLSVFWCHYPDGSPACVVAEVHNTYGQRHCYLLRPDAEGRADVDKAFYVSPFYPVDGRYRMSLPEPGERLSLTIALHREGEPPFVAGVHGRGRPATLPALLRTVARHPAATLVVSARIRVQGVRLWVRGLKVVARPVHPREETVQ
jgi:DUF1365 family protein